MSLERYVENAWLRREATSAQEITDQLGTLIAQFPDGAPVKLTGFSDLNP
jgi:hypothetical protein